MRYIWAGACLGTGLVLAVGLLFSGPTSVSGQDKQKPRQVWQYKVLDGYKLQEYDGAKSLEDGLNNLGAEGWEIVAIDCGIPRPGSVTANEKDPTKPVYFAKPPTYYFKRQKQ